MAAAVICAVYFSSADVVAQQRGLGAVTGVVSSEAGEPVNGASVKFMLPNGETVDGKSDGAGKWRVGGLGKGEWRVLFAADGFATKVVKFVVERETITGGDPVKIVLKKA
jgi:hypothetical protein